MSDQAVFDKYKLENSGVGGSRLDLPSQVFGSLGDMFGGSLGLFNSSGEGYLNSQGEFVPRTCFTAGTLVHTSTGAKKIEEVKVGDQVLSWDEESGEQEYHRVVKTFQREVNVVYTIVYSNGTQVETTDEHPFYIENKGWVPAKDLRSGDRSVLSNEKTLEIESIRISERTTTVYNFEVEDAHSYYVSEVGILVHNDCVLTGPSMSLAAFNALLKYMPGASEAEIEAARKLIEIGNRPVDGTMDAVFDVAAYIDAACKNGCPPDIAMAPIKLGVSGLKVASELIRSGRFKEALSLFGSGVKNWVKGSDNANQLISELNRLGIKNSPGEIVEIARDASGKIIFLEAGNSKAGLTHIIEDHAEDFLSKGIQQNELPTFLMKAATEGKIVGYSGAGTGRPVYEIMYKGQKQTVGITIGTNGFIVGANPVSIYRSF
ncbi:toxin HINT domain protein [Leptospira weilii str. UI 13098]|uniref:Toxin HINT domain protein n=1 Tax=Leptospira weilii str. UI 13098 TaxID=1088542 RepID=M6Q4U2_9LEPT|nr:toxin HINT domain protein [Leptospira weilii str. UI 13098]